jgi:hypothetical protein
MAFDADTTAHLVELAHRQKQFLSSQLIEIRTKLFALLDTPLDDHNEMTLRRHIMPRAPDKHPTKRIFHNVDFSWSQPNVCLCTTVKAHQTTADNALNDIIPEVLHTYGPAAGKWFTQNALLMYENIKWDPKKRSTTTQTSNDTAKILYEDLWGLKDLWKSTPFASAGSPSTAVTNMTAVGITIDHMNLTNAGDIAFFGSLYTTGTKTMIPYILMLLKCPNSRLKKRKPLLNLTPTLYLVMPAFLRTPAQCQCQRPPSPLSQHASDFARLGTI